MAARIKVDSFSLSPAMVEVLERSLKLELMVKDKFPPYLCIKHSGITAKTNL